MIETVTLEIPKALLTRARETAKASNRPIETILTEWIEQGALSEYSTLLLTDTAYHIYTPYGNEQAAQVLSDFLNDQ